MLRAIRRMLLPILPSQGGTGNLKGILGDGTTYIDSGMVPTLPYSGIDHSNLISAGSSNYTNPTVPRLYGGIQANGNPALPTGGGAVRITTTGSAPTKTITGFTVAPTNTVTISIATTAVVTINIATDEITDTAHGLVANTPIRFTTTGALPAELSVGVTYYVKTVLSANTYNVSATPAGTFINLTGTQSGVHTRIGPGVITDTLDGLGPNTPVSFTTTGALPTGLSVGVTYYIKQTLSPTTYAVAATPGGAAISTTGTQSGVHTRVTTAGEWSWPPAIVIFDATGAGAKIDAVLNTTTMTTMTTSAGAIVSGGVRYAVPAYTHTYAPTPGSIAAYLDYINKTTSSWVTIDPRFDPPVDPATHILVQFVIVGGATSWPNNNIALQPQQIYSVNQIAGIIPRASRVYSTEQQGTGQASQGYGNDYVPLMGVDAGNGGCNFKGRYFSFSNDDPSVSSYSTAADGGPQIIMSRVLRGRPPQAGDLTASFGVGTQSSNSGDAVGMQTIQICAKTIDPTAGQMQGAIVFAGAFKDVGGASSGFFEMGPGLISYNTTDGPASYKGFDTINLNAMINSDGNKGGYYIVDKPTGEETSLTNNKVSFGNGDITITRTGANSLGFAGAANAYSFDNTMLADGIVWAGHNSAIIAGGSVAGLWLSTTSTFGVFFGSGAPTISAAKGSLYLRSDGTGVNDRMYVNHNGTTGWHAVVTVA